MSTKPKRYTDGKKIPHPNRTTLRLAYSPFKGAYTYRQKSLKTQMREYHGFHAPSKEEARRAAAKDAEKMRKFERDERRRRASSS